MYQVYTTTTPAAAMGPIDSRQAINLFTNAPKSIRETA